jgi:hypothetical protein
MERNNNGVFPINYFESILIELDVNAKLSSLIISYLKKKTQKSFIDFHNLKHLIYKFSESYEDMIEIIFEILSYPMDYIKRSDLLKLIKSFRSDDLSKT